MQIMIDMDGVLVDFIKGVEKLFNIELNPYPCPGKFDFFTHLGISDKEHWEQLDDAFYSSLEWTEEGKEILEICKYYVGVENICILTSATLHPGCLAGKLCWIQREIPELSRQYLMGPRKQFASNSNRILIDDADFNIDAWDGPAILVPRVWNKGGHQNVTGYIKLMLHQIIKRNQYADLYSFTKYKREYDSPRQQEVIKST